MRGYYSMIQFCPDLSRAEAANVGVLLFCPDARFIKARMSNGNDRVRRFFKEYAIDLERLNATKLSIEGRLRASANDFQSLEDLERFIASRANEVLITPARPIRVDEPETDLQTLFNELVGGRQHRAPIEGSIVSTLEQVFRQQRFNGKVEFSKKIRLPVAEREIEVPIAYRNGVLNLVQATTLSNLASRAMNTALQLAGEGTLIDKHPIEGQDAKLIVVYGFGGAQPGGEMSNRIQNLFNDFQIRAFPRAGIEEFADAVEREAH
jgi:hypothetical protein